MTRIKLALIACAIVALVGIIVLRADRETSVDLVAAQAPTTYTVETVPETTTTTTRGWNQMTTDEWSFVNTWYAAENAPPPTTTVPPAAPKKVAPKAAAPKKPAYTAEQGNGQCGGDLPPCYVMNRESGGNIRAKNPTSSASGKWQFLDSTWQGYGGYTRAMDAPEEVQDARARQLYAGGRGCSHWSC